MPRLIRVLCAILAACTGTIAHAQLSPHLIYNDHHNGASHRFVTVALKDKDGLMWFGTWNGINRFDGISFKVFDYSRDRNNNMLKGGRISQLMEGEQDVLWVLTYNKEIYWFDKQTEEFHSLAPVIEERLGKDLKVEKILAVTCGYIWLSTGTNGLIAVSYNRENVLWYHKNNETEYRLKSDKIHFLQKDKNEKIWIGTEVGMNLLERTDKNGPYYVRKSQYQHTNNAIRKIIVGKWGLAFSPTNEDVYLYNYKTDQIQYIKVGESPINNMLFSKSGSYLYITNMNGELLRVDLQTKESTKLAVYPSSLYAMFEDSRGNLWIELASEGVLHFNRDFNQTTVYRPKYRQRSPTVPFFCFEDEDKRVWISFRGGGFGYYDDLSQKFNFSIEEDRKSVELPQYNYRFYYDSTGVIWLFSEEKGIGRIVLERKLIKHHFLENDADKPLSEDVRSLLLTDDNTLLAGTRSGKLYIKDGKGWHEPLWMNKPHLNFGGIYSLFQDHEKTLWLGTKEGGLLKAIKDNGSYKLEQFDTNNSLLESNQIYNIFQDKKGTLWIGTFGRGLYQKIEKDGKIDFQKLVWKYNIDPTIFFDKIRFITEDNTGNLWIATTDGLAIKSIDEKIYFFRNRPQDHIYIGNNNIQYIFGDDDGAMWLCTSGGGVTKVTGDPAKQLKFENLGVEQGLYSGFVLSGGVDRFGSLWFATENGLFKYNKDKGKFYNINTATNIGGFYFSEKTVVMGAESQLFFGSTRGVVELIDRSRIDQSQSPKLVLTKLLINNVEHNLIGKEKKVNINYLDRLVLDHDQNNISIDFAVTDFKLNHFNFAYRLLGIDTLWHQNGDINRATFTNLSPGKYILEIQNDQDYYEQPRHRQLEIVILSPWWRTWWAYTIYIVLIGIACFLTKRLVQSMWNLRHEVTVEKKMADVKMQFFTNVSHELRTPLTLILSPMEQLITERKLDDRGMECLKLIDKNAKRMQRFVDQLLDLRKIQERKYVIKRSPVEFVAFLKQTIDNFKITAAEKNVQIKLNFAKEHLYLSIDKESIESVIYNLLSNALKYTPRDSCVEIRLDIDNAHKTVRVTVKDEGPGVEEQELSKIFDLFHSDSTIRKDKSSGIGLALCKELVVLHGGEISAHNRKSKGLEVTLTLAIKHEDSESILLVNEHAETPHITADASYNERLRNVLHVEQTAKTKHPQILIVEDNEDLRYFLQAQLSDSFDILLAENGAIGVDMAKKNLPDLIISDVMMPVLDGIELVRELKSNKDTSHIPIILLSAKHAIETQIKGLEYGADCYITKPFRRDHLFISIQNLIKQRKIWFDKILARKDLLISSDDKVITDRDSTFLKAVIAIVEEKMADSDLNMDKIADELKLGRHTFYMKFKSLTRMLPVEFVRDLRLEKAKKMLDQKTHSIAEVAYAVGFNTPKYFSTCFKEKYGLSPRAYVQAKKK